MRSTEQPEFTHQHTKESPRAAFARVVRLLWQSRLKLATITAAFFLASVIVSLVLPPLYEANTRILPAPASKGYNDITRMLRPETAALAGLAGVTTPDQGRFMAILQSRVLSDRIIDHFGLMPVYGAKRLSDARTVLANRTAVQEDRKTGVITISVQDRDPKRAADLASAYVTELDRLNIEENSSGAHLERVFLEKRLEEIASELTESNKQLSQFSTKNSILDAQDQLKSTVGAAMELQGQIVAAEAEVRGLEEIYQADSLKIRTAKAKVAELNRQLSLIRGSDPEKATKGFPSIHNLPALGVTYSELYRRCKLLEIVQTALTEQLEIAKTEEVKAIPAFHTLDPSEIPDLRVSPKRTQLVIASTALGFVGGILWIIFYRRWAALSADDPIKSLWTDAQYAFRRKKPPTWRKESVNPEILIETVGERK